MVYKVTKKNIRDAMISGKRLDGRGSFDMRDIEVRFNVSNKAEGSVGVKFGKTEVLCGIKMNTAEPYTDHEAEGTMSVGADLLPLASPNFDYGQPSIEAVEIARVVDRGIRESRFIDFEKLCIKEGEKVWCINVDLAIINDDGNLIDACALAAILALVTARYPVYDEKEDKISFGEASDKSLPLRLENMPLTMTGFKIGNSIFIDPTREEEDAAEARLTIEVSDSGEFMINAMQKGGEMAMTIEEVDSLIKEATKIFKKLKSVVDTEVAKFEKSFKKKGKKE